MTLKTSSVRFLTVAVPKCGVCFGTATVRERIGNGADRR